MSRWPKDTQAARNAFYGDPGKGQIARQMVPVVPPFAMFYEGKRIKAIQFHKLAAPALLAALNEIWDAYGRDQRKIDAAGVSKYNGAYNHRMVRGSKTKWSNHAYAAAIDINAEQNGLYAKGNIPQPVIDAFTRQGAMWGGWYTGRKDPMHFEFVDNGGRKPKNPAPTWPPIVGLMSDPEGDAPPADEFEDDPASESVPAQPVAAEPPVTPPHGEESGRFSLVQERLKALGYHEVGEVDGKWGGRTAAAIAAFKNDRHLPGEPVIDDALMVAIDQAAADPAWKRPIAAARAEAKPAEVAEKVETVKQSGLAKFWAWMLGLPAGIMAAGKGVLEQVGSAKGYLDPVKEVLGEVPMEYWLGGLAVVAFLIWRSSQRAETAGVEAYREGRIN